MWEKQAFKCIIGLIYDTHYRTKSTYQGVPLFEKSFYKLIHDNYDNNNILIIIKCELRNKT